MEGGRGGDLLECRTQPIGPRLQRVPEQVAGSDERADDGCRCERLAGRQVRLTSADEGLARRLVVVGGGRARAVRLQDARPGRRVLIRGGRADRAGVELARLRVG